MYTSKRGRPVWFLRAPPLVPASPRQRHQRNRFVVGAHVWTSMPPAEKLLWARACQLDRIRITPYNLFIWWALSRRDDIIHSIELRTGITLLPIGHST